VDISLLIQYYPLLLVLLVIFGIYASTFDTRFIIFCNGLVMFLAVYPFHWQKALMWLNYHGWPIFTIYISIGMLFSIALFSQVILHWIFSNFNRTTFDFSYDEPDALIRGSQKMHNFFIAVSLVFNFAIAIVVCIAVVFFI